MEVFKIAILLSSFFTIFNLTSCHNLKNADLASIEDFPFQVSIEVNRKSVCGGAIIGDYWVVTARSCLPINTTEVELIRVRAGTEHLGHRGAFHTVSKIIKYSSLFHLFSHESADMALLKVSSPFIYAPTLRWASPDADSLKGNGIVISGWGIHNDYSLKILAKSTVNTISYEKCVEAYEGLLNITSSMTCLVPATSNDNACIADVGSPVSSFGLVTAVVTNNKYCWENNLPLVVTNIRSFGYFLVFSMSEPVLRSEFEQFL